MKINPPSGPTNISSTYGASGGDFNPQEFAAQFSNDVGAVSDALNHMISLVNQGASNTDINNAFYQLMLKMQTAAPGQNLSPLDQDINQLEQYKSVPNNLLMLLNQLHTFTQSGINLSDKSQLMDSLSDFRDNLVQFTSGVKSAAFSVDNAPLNTAISKQKVDQDFSSYMSLLQEYTDGKVAPQDLQYFQETLYASFNNVSNDIAELYTSLSPSQMDMITNGPFSFDEMQGLNANFCTDSNPPSLDDANNLMTVMKSMQSQIDSFNF